MVLKVYTIYDSKVEAYMSPFLARSKGEGIRMFENELGRPDSMIAKHPEDYTLFEIGEYDDSVGVYKMLDAKCSLGNGLEHRRQPEVAE